MRRGIITEIQTKHWVILTSDGSFIKVLKKNNQIQIGEEISFLPVDICPQGNRNWKLYLSGAVAAILALFFLIPIFQTDEVLAQSYVYVEINPSVEFGLNDSLEVVSLRALNKDAEHVIDGLKWEKMNIDEAVKHYVHHAQQKGYFQQTDEIIISTIQKDNNKNPSENEDKWSKQKNETLQMIQEELNQDPQLKQSESNIHVYTFSLPEIIKEKAEEKGVTPARYGLWLLSKKTGKEISIEEVMKTRVTDLISDSSVSAILEDTLSEDDWEEIVEETQHKEDFFKHDEEKTKQQNKLDDPLPSPTDESDPELEDKSKDEPPYKNGDIPKSPNQTPTIPPSEGRNGNGVDTDDKQNEPSTTSGGTESPSHTP